MAHVLLLNVFSALEENIKDFKFPSAQLVLCRVVVVQCLPRMSSKEQVMFYFCPLRSEDQNFHTPEYCVCVYVCVCGGV